MGNEAYIEFPSRDDWSPSRPRLCMGDEQLAICEDMEAAEMLRDALNARPQPAGECGELVEMDIFVHSHADTGKPLCVDVFRIKGDVDLSWLHEAFENLNEEDQHEIAGYFIRNGAELDAVTTCVVKQAVENAGETPELYAEFVRLGTLDTLSRPQSGVCEWSAYDNEHMPGTFEGSCGALWTFTEGGVKDNDMRYCPKCGCKVKQALEKGGNT